MKRRAFDLIAGFIGLGLAAALLVAGGLLTWANTFVGDEVHDQLAAQQIYFPPEGSDAINVTGHHLHVADAARARGGHLFDCVLLEGVLQIDHSSDVHAELPPGVAIPTTVAAARAAAVAVAERER